MPAWCGRQGRLQVDLKGRGPSGRGSPLQGPEAGGHLPSTVSQEAGASRMLETSPERIQGQGLPLSSALDEALVSVATPRRLWGGQDRSLRGPEQR